MAPYYLNVALSLWGYHYSSYGNYSVYKQRSRIISLTVSFDELQPLRWVFDGDDLPRLVEKERVLRPNSSVVIILFSCYHKLSPVACDFISRN